MCSEVHGTMEYEPGSWSFSSHSVSSPTSCPLILGHWFLIPGVLGPAQTTPLSCTLKPGAITRSHWLRERPKSHVCFCPLLLIDIWLVVCGGQMHAPCHQEEKQGCGHPHPELAALWWIQQASHPPQIQVLRISQHGGWNHLGVTHLVDWGHRLSSQVPALSFCTELHKFK